MGTAFYLQDSRFWHDAFHRQHFRLGMPLRDFEMVRDVLMLASPEDGSSGHIAADALLLKIAKARLVL